MVLRGDDAVRHRRTLRVSAVFESACVMQTALRKRARSDERLCLEARVG